MPLIFVVPLGHFFTNDEVLCIRVLRHTQRVRQHCRLSICSYFGRVWQILNLRQAGLSTQGHSVVPLSHPHCIEIEILNCVGASLHWSDFNQKRPQIKFIPRPFPFIGIAHWKTAVKTKPESPSDQNWQIKWFPFSKSCLVLFLGGLLTEVDYWPKLANWVIVHFPFFTILSGLGPFLSGLLSAHPPIRVLEANC